MHYTNITTNVAEDHEQAKAIAFKAQAKSNAAYAKNATRYNAASSQVAVLQSALKALFASKYSQNFVNYRTNHNKPFIAIKVAHISKRSLQKQYKSVREQHTALQNLLQKHNATLKITANTKNSATSAIINLPV